jgi:diguanylate cyclase (GGDEF)-like protein
MTEAATAKILPLPAAERLRILLLEDHPGDALLVRTLLAESSSRPPRVDTVATLEAARRRLAQVTYDAVIADLDVPDSDGFGTLRQLFEAAETTPVIALTHCEDEAFTINLLKNGAEDYLIKGQSEGRLILRTVRHAIERKEAERRFLFLSHYDKLTGLANRELFRDRLRQAIARAERSGRLVALLFLDLDRFKAVNDTLGHMAGDELLVEVANRLQNCVRKADTIARLGGDEFTVVLEELESKLDAEAICNKIIHALEQPIVVQRHELYVTTSIGVTFFPVDDTDANALLRNADAAMYRAKEEGRNKYHVFTQDLGASAVRRMGIESALRHAVEREEFFLSYQPKLDVRTGAVLGAEALLRWNNPQLGMVSPADFIPVAEDTGLIVPIGEWALRRACRDALAWQREGAPGLHVAVNLSARQFRGGDLAQTVRKILGEVGIAPELLQLEITESLLMEDTTASADALNELKSLGLEIFLDDFGTGYSSLAYLKKFPIDGLKIDRSFIRDLPTDSDDEAITRAILALSQALRLRVVAEGVENHAQYDFLRCAGCDEVQGYFFSAPTGNDDFLRWLAEWRGEGRKAVAY